MISVNLQKMQEKRQIITTKDGSKTIHFPDINENYHSQHGALQEAQHVFFKNGLNHFLDKDEIYVFEVGFGTGLNTLLALEYALQQQKKITYHTIEAFPITLEEATQLNYASYINDESLKKYATLLHNLSWNEEHILDEFFRFTKFHEKIEVHSLPNEHYHCIFFDAFAPRVQDELWTVEIFNKMYQSLHSNGLLVTYCAKGQVKRDLKSVGFNVEAVDGPPGKREMTLAWKK